MATLSEVETAPNVPSGLWTRSRASWSFPRAIERIGRTATETVVEAEVAWAARWKAGKVRARARKVSKVRAAGSGVFASECARWREIK